ncbi:PREDICTED: leucine-rich repeat-containing protein 9-like [Nanorana parkeri]|uniref:leucine-rich repeat-containing protein 9-like n=1 Tax=Nanorana parkeri TaxID=125878 RepID=UPI00085496A2|nr:PREDICTED: leucine-rich repeat-containing protein 9-like [Nanorana parkeri]
MDSVDNQNSEEIFKELCACNGVSYEKIAQEGPSTKTLEMFFSGYPKMVGLSYFPNLTNLTLNGQNIENITGLESCPLLQNLWIIECQLTKIECLETCLHLKRLFLYCNSITSIESLENLTQLEVLWLNDNQIEVIEGLETLQNLKELNLAGNLIHSIGCCLDPNVNLERLNLSGNTISSFKELTNLARLKNLKDLGLKDPQYTPNPVCLFCNYSTHVLYHIPQLQRLDTYNVSQKSIKDLAESTVMKKIMYYNMRVKTINRQLREDLDMLKEQKCKLEPLPRNRKCLLLFQVKSLEWDLSKLQSPESLPNISKSPEKLHCHGDLEKSDSWTKVDNSTAELDMEKNLTQKLCALKERIHFWTSKMDDIDGFHEKEVARTKESFDLLVQFLQTELETVGNVRFEEGAPSDTWFKSCYDLILSRFCALNFKTFGISGVKINRIVRVHNRILRSKFEDRVQDYLDGEDSTANENYKKMLEYLFYTFEPSFEKKDLLHILEDGFNVNKTVKLHGQEQGGSILLSNSLGFCETFTSEQATTLETNYDPEHFKRGKLIIVKVFLGRSLRAKEHLQINPNANSVFRPLKFKRDHVYPSDDEACSSKEHGNCDCSLRRREWFVFDPELILPEYIVEFEYIPLVQSSNFQSGDSENASAEMKEDEDILSMEPVVKPRPKIISLDESTILSIAKASTYSQISVLNLHGNSLSKLKEISKLHGLRKLIISFNEFSSLEDVSCLPNLEYIDASHNNVKTLEGFKGLAKLKHLDLSWNQLTRIRADMNILRKQTPHLLSLHIAHNPWQKPASVRMATIGRLKTLTRLDGVLITEEEVSQSSKFFPEGQITKASLLMCARTDNVKPRCLSLLPSAQILSQISKNCLDPYAECNNSWYLRITSINFDGQKLSKISHLEKLENLRWASFSNNYLTNTEGLENCVKLEELCLDGNNITKLEGLSKLIKLRRLSINDNQLASFAKEVIDNLPHLHYLSAENNSISCLGGLQKAYLLIELYLSNNQISSNQEIYHLKGLNNLVILDLWGNPISVKNDNYRLFVIFHLSSLKALDGSAVDQLESENAKDIFGGRLSSDMIVEKLGHQKFTELQELNWRSSSIRSVDLVPADQFRGIHTVNLENNNLTSFSGLIFLPHIKNLYLNYNHIESILPKQKSQNHLTNRQILHQKVNSSGYGQQGKATRDALFGEMMTPIMQSLEVLHLGYNGISNLPQLQLSRLRNLKSLFLQGNEITQVEGLEGLQFLQDLVLDHNRIKLITETSLAKQSSLVSLRLEENRLREVSNLLHLITLKKLYIGFNKIQEISEVEKLEALPTLLELSVSGNPISRKMFHRQLLILRLQNLQILDGIALTSEERTRADMYSLEQQALLAPNPVLETVHPVSTFILTKPPPLRITNVYLPGGSHHFASPDLHLNNGQDDFLPNDSNKYKKSKNNPRSVNAEIAFRPLRVPTNISTSYLAQAGPNRVAQSNPEHEGRSFGNGNLRQNRM